MSTTANVYFLVIFLMFLVITSFSSCSARPIVENGEKPYSKHSQFSTQKDGEKESVARVSIPAKVEHSEAYKYAAAAEEEGEKEQVYDEGNKKAMKADHENPERKSEVENQLHGSDHQESSSILPSSVQNNYKPLVETHEQRVTWKLPQKKRGEKQPGFNLDYAPPKTHPPTHN